MAATEQIIPSSILDGQVHRPVLFDKDEFAAFRERMLGGAAPTWDEAARLSEEQYTEVLNALLVNLSERAEPPRPHRQNGLVRN